MALDGGGLAEGGKKRLNVAFASAVLGKEGVEDYLCGGHAFDERKAFFFALGTSASDGRGALLLALSFAKSKDDAAKESGADHRKPDGKREDSGYPATQSENGKDGKCGGEPRVFFNNILGFFG